MFHSLSRSLTSLSLAGNSISVPVLTTVALELVLCQLRNPLVATIDACDKGFNDEQAHAIAQALGYGIKSACILIVLAGAADY